MTSTPRRQDSYTYQRLEHATAEHLHLTTRRCFIGPIPQGWLDSHRREWYRHHLGIHYSSRAATFTAGPDVGRHRRLTGLDGPSVSATYRSSFPQPTELDQDEDREEDNEDNEEDDDERLDPQEQADRHPDAPAEAEATTRDPPAIRVPRGSYDNEDPDLQGLAHAEPVATHGQVTPIATGTPRDRSPNPQPSDALDPATASVASDDTIKAAVEPSKDTKPNVDDTRESRQGHGQESESSSSQSQVWLSAPSSKIASESSSSPSQTYHSARGSRVQSSKDSSSSRPTPARSTSGSSFVTANEDVAETPRRLSVVDEADSKLTTPKHLSAVGSDAGHTTIGAASTRQNSTRSLLPRDEQGNKTDSSEPTTAFPDPSSSDQAQSASQPSKSDQTPEQQQVKVDQPGLVRFDIPEDEQSKQRLVKVRLAQMRKRDTFKQLRRGKVHDGEIVKMEKMLARVDLTSHDVPSDFTEAMSEKIERTTLEKWKEFMLVCRENDDEDTPFVLQLYRSRVIPAIEKTRVKKRWTYEIQLRRSNCRINLFSSLDKTMVVWHPSRRGNKIFTLQARAGANSMEWYTFLRNTLGGRKTEILTIGVPDLGVNLRIEKPFENLESTTDVVQAAQGDEEAMIRTIKEEQAAVVNIIQRCLAMIEKSPDWKSVLDSWNGAERMGLAWKRYDRLEWIHGANEKKMYGTIGMEASHELELRPKQHYPTSVGVKIGQEPVVEPPPVEGFLIRLTSQRGVDQKLGRLFFKRLYFSTHNQFLVFNRPAKSDPPPPPKMPMTEQDEIPSSEQISQKTPLIYSINPYPLTQAKHIEWLNDSGRFAEHDRDAYDEDQRKTRNLLNCDGLLNLCSVELVRDVRRGATPADERVNLGEEVDFDVHVSDSTRDDGSTRDMDDHRVFELLMTNGLVVRLQAFDQTTKNEWKARLSALVSYWKQRTTADANLYKQVREDNLRKLRMDEATEAVVGQFAQKWEVQGSHASPELYNMCGISSCRTVHMAGPLYRKPRMHGAFSRHLTLLAHGRLLMFADSVRAPAGTLVKHIHHERVATLDLRDCYVYSGLATSADLLYQSSGHDASRHGRHALPRMYAADDGGWSSSDEDTATTFVVWHGKRTSWFKSQGAEAGGRTRARIKKVRTLGQEGRSVVFRTRSRAERDHWVLSIAMEIERLYQGEDVRIEDV